jgi:hypothetical protein
MIKLILGSTAVRQRFNVSLWAFMVSAMVGGPAASAAPDKLQVVPKWTRFEQSFKSAQSYSNPLRDCTLKVVFVSPLGETNQVYGFWDGGRTWRVRFAPYQLGRWTYQASCSDPANAGLQNQNGAFLCTAAVGIGRFSQHGPLRLARDQRHFEHADGTPFFWLADSVWNGARLSNQKDWTAYAQIRANQAFTAAQWSVAPGVDSENQVAFVGRSQIVPSPGFFQRLDEKIETLNRAGLLSVIAPLWNVDPKSVDSLSEEQLALLIRYLVARWGANHVAWLLTSPGNDPANGAAWKRIGQAEFPASRHAPVILFAGDSPPALKGFRDESWVDAFGCVTGSGVPERTNSFTRRLIPIVSPYENSVPDGSDRRIDATEVRRSVWWNLLISSPSFLSYGTQAVADWNPTVDKEARGFPLWQRSLFLPGAKQLAFASGVFTSIPFWNLQSAPEALVVQPGNEHPIRYIAAAQTETKDLSLFYVPAERTLEVALNALPPSPLLLWINPRTGESSTAVAVVGPQSIKFPTPDSGDWILLAKSSK